MPYAIVRIAKLKKSSIGGSGSHVARSRTTLNADKSKQADNRTLIHSQDSDRPLGDVVAAKIASSKQKRKIRPDAVHAVEFLLSASPEYFRPNDPTEYGVHDPTRLEVWTRANVEWLQREYGDRIVRAELHLDEATPHIHAYLVPIDERGQLNCRGIFGERKNMFALQDSYAAAMEPLGIERGIRGSKARHTDVKEYYAAVNEYVGGEGASITAGLQAENTKLERRLLDITAKYDGVVASLQAENARLDQCLSDITDERDKLREKIESLAVNTPGITPITSKTTANRPPSRSPISDGDPTNHIRRLLAMALKNEPTAVPPEIVTLLSTITLPEIEKAEVVTPTLAINPPEIDRSGGLTESEREEVKKISSRSSAKSRDRGGR